MMRPAADEVRNCTTILCPLHAYRPFRQAKTARGEQFSATSAGAGICTPIAADEAVA
jgi:hypothetical protein